MCSQVKKLSGLLTSRSHLSYHYIYIKLTYFQIYAVRTGIDLDVTEHLDIIM